MFLATSIKNKSVKMAAIVARNLVIGSSIFH